MRVALALCVLVGVARAAPTRKVLVETDPPGATVYLNDKEAGPVCASTPCTVEVPASGEANLIIEAASYAPEFASVDLSKRGKLSVKVTLKKAVGTITIEAPKGATVTVDDVDSGTVPAHLDVEAGGHHVVVTAGGKNVFDDFVNVDVNEDVPVTPSGAKPDPGDGDTDKPEQPAPAPSRKARRPYVTASLAVDLGFRSFAYENPMKNANNISNTRSEDEGGQVLAGPLIEVYPTAIAGSSLLPGLALVLRYQYGLNGQTVNATGFTEPVTTFWQALEISAKYRFVLFDQMSLEVGGGYLKETYRFNGKTNDIALVPDADYAAVRIGARVGYLGEVAGMQLEPYLVLESRFVTSGGALQARFTSASATGLHGALGVQAHFGALGVRLEGSLTSYSWSFSSSEAMPDYVATGGSDSIKKLGLSIGYTY